MIFLILLAPLMVFFSYRQGLREGKRNEILPIINIKKRGQGQDRKLQILWENINNYDGTKNNQKLIDDE